MRGFYYHIQITIHVIIFTGTAGTLIYLFTVFLVFFLWASTRLARRRTNHQGFINAPAVKKCGGFAARRRHRPLGRKQGSNPRIGTRELLGRRGGFPNGRTWLGHLGDPCGRNTTRQPKKKGATAPTALPKGRDLQGAPLRGGRATARHPWGETALSGGRKGERTGYSLACRRRATAPRPQHGRRHSGRL